MQKDAEETGNLKHLHGFLLKNIFKTVQSLDLGLRVYFGTDKSHDCTEGSKHELDNNCLYKN